jgi:HD superfamily phosphohydrolase
MARTLFFSSDLALSATEKKEAIKSFAGNHALCKITEDLIFTDPYRVAEQNRWTSPWLDATAADIRADLDLHVAISRLKLKFLSCAEALIHGDLDELSPGERVLRGLLSGTLDMDKLDYLPRDAHGCSVPYGGVDTSRLLESLVIVEPPVGLRIGVNDKGVSPLHSLINARQEMFDNVYWHHTNRACMVMLLRAVQDALVEGLITPTSLTNHDDASLLATMRGVSMPDSTQRLAEALASRKIHKRALEVSAGAFELYSRLGNLWFDPRARREVELELSAALAQLIGEPVSSTAVLIDIPKPERWKTDVWVSFERPPVGFHSLMHWQDVVGLGDDDFKRYEEHRRLIRIVTEAQYRDIVTAHWEDLLYPLLGGAF